MIRDSDSGKKEEVSVVNPKYPKKIKPITMIFTAMGYLIKYAIIFFMLVIF
jgi:hypothetical protein